MRVLTTSLVAILAAISIAACSSSSSSSSTDTTSASSASTTDMSASSAATTDNTAASSTAASPASGGAASTDNIPAYPGATTMASGSSSMNMAGGSAAGKVMSTGDSFAKVYAWYQKNMPAGAEKAHTTTPAETAVFTVGDPGNQQSVTITVAGGKTMITIAHTKM